ncbi:DUF6708 domain-containing protein [Pseudomonas sp. NPDC089530]|uniref:DUF6708 domain-containing protein n=1 Tax=Pseudomonas sp. NPDC089530 TaxID=3390651 RepID=UPI003D012B5B
MTSATPGSRKGLLSREDYLAPPAIPTGQTPKDVLNTIWRKNEVFLDIGSYSIGSAVMVIWPSLLVAILILWNTGGFGGRNLGLTIMFAFMLGIPILIILHSLTKPAPPPVRFNRQRREVCVPFKDGRYWIVPWEQVTAQAVALDSVGQHGKTTQGLLVVGFHNPDPNAPEIERDFSLSFSCGGGETAMSLWECMRSYMEIGADAVPDSRLGRKPYAETQIGSIVTSLFKGDILDVLHGLFFIVFLGTYLAEKLQNWKLAPPPELIDPAIVEWSKPLPPEQWAQRSAELEQAIRLREAELEKEAQAA